MLAKELRTPRERRLFTILSVVSALGWTALVVGTLGVGLIYMVFIGGFVMMAHALFLAHVMGNGVRVDVNQLPGLHQKVITAARRLGLSQVPEVYIMQSGGVLNAFATKFLSRRFVVLYSDLLDACEEAGADGDGPGELDFIIAHEIGHLAAGHLTWKAFLMPGQLMPWLGPAYSRACEYTCDRCGYAVVDDLEPASRALAMLAAGGRYSRRVNLDAFVAQRQQTGSFWQAVYELNSSHPYLSKRIAALREMVRPGTIRVVPRSRLSYALAPMFGIASGGSAAAPMMVVAVVGILAAVAIPAFTKYVKQAQAAQLEAEEQRRALEEIELGGDYPAFEPEMPADE